MTTTTAKSARSGNPATRAAAAKETAAAKKARIEAEAQARKEADEERARRVEEFQNLVLPEAKFDEDGYEIVPDKSALEGGSYKFKVGGQAYVLPNLQYLPVALASKMMNAPESEANALIFNRYAPGLLEHASADQLIHVVKRWREYSAGVGLGE